MSEPYYRDEWVTLYHGDCREVTAWLAADVLVTDPPYGIRFKQRLGDARHVRRQTHVHDVVEGDKDTALRDAALSLWGNRPAMVFGTWRVARPAGTRSLLIWHKDGSYSGPLNAPFFTNHEEIYVIGEGWRSSAPPLRSVITTTEHRAVHARALQHPTPKPLPLMLALLDRCPAGIITDPFAGAGATLVAAKAIRRRAVGVEIHEPYCEVTAGRLSQDLLDFGAVS